MVKAQGRCVIVCPGKIVFWLVIWFFLFAIVRGYSPSGFIDVVISGVLPVYMIAIHMKGYVIDTSNDKFSYPGGSQEANSFLSYFNPFFYLQGMIRHSIPLSSINTIRPFTNVKFVEGSSGGQPTLSIFKKHKLQISGDFGVVILTFSSKNKRDQVLDTIARYNGMI